VVRVAAIKALEGIGPGAKEALPLLTQFSKDKDEKVREAAREALKKIAPDSSDAVKDSRGEKKDGGGDSPPR